MRKKGEGGRIYERGGKEEKSNYILVDYYNTHFPYIVNLSNMKFFHRFMNLY